MTDRRAQALLVALGIPALLWPAFLNGFPLVFMDTWWYVAPLFGLPGHVGRLPGYTLFAGAAVAFHRSLWSIAVAQAALTSLLLVRVAFVVMRGVPGRRAWAAASIGLALLVSGVAKYASWLMPDVFTGWLFLSGVLLFVGGRADRALAIGVATLSLASHNVHLPLALATGGAVTAVAWVSVPGLRRRALTSLGLVALLGAATTLVGGRLLDGRSGVLRGTSAFLANKFVDTGVMGATLDRYCPEKDWAACAHRDWFARHEGRADDEFLFAFDSPFLTDMGAWVGGETGDIVDHAFRCCAVRIVATSLADTWTQLWRIDSSDGIALRGTLAVRRMLGDSPIHAELMEGRQARGLRVRVRPLPVPEVPLQALLLALGAAVSGLAWQRGERRPAWLFAALVAFLVANAAICAFGSTTHDRYQGRVAWLLPYVVVLAGGLAAAAREGAGAAGEPEPGT